MWSWVAGLACLSVALLGLAGAAVVFSGFVETDRDPTQLAQAALLSFGAGALLVVPFAWASWMFLRSDRVRLPLLAFLLGPWMALGALWVAVGRFDPLIGAVPAVVALAAIWAGWKLNRR